jgi:hypothetical protein
MFTGMKGFKLFIIYINMSGFSRENLEFISDGFSRCYNAVRCEHLRKQRMSYCTHLQTAFGYSYYSAKAAITFFIHGLFPFVFETTGSNIIHGIDNALRITHKNS